jgi:hypothetical protein
MWQWIIFIPLILIGLFLISMVIIWIVTSLLNFPDHIQPGGSYIVDGRHYNVPLLPHKRYGSPQEARLDRPVPMLAKATLKDLRALIVDTTTTLKEAGVDYWATGGTLISAVLWHQLMSYDDDADFGVSWKDREYLWSPEFATLLDQHGLETFYLKGASLRVVNSIFQKEGCSLRIRRKGTIYPTADIFFVKERPDGSWAKVNTWNGDKVTYNTPEIWPSADWLFPLQEVAVDGMTWSIARRPELMLDQQYGPEWNQFINSPCPFTNSHRWIFWISNRLGLWRRGKLSSETDLTKLVRSAHDLRSSIA